MTSLKPSSPSIIKFQNYWNKKLLHQKSKLQKVDLIIQEIEKESKETWKSVDAYSKKRLNQHTNDIGRLSASELKDQRNFHDACLFSYDETDYQQDNELEDISKRWQNLSVKKEGVMTKISTIENTMERFRIMKI